MVIKKGKDSVIVLGNTGMLGWAVENYLRFVGFDVLAFGRRSFDAEKDNPQSFLEEKVREQSYIVNCIGIIKPRCTKENLMSTILVNSLFPHRLAEACNRLECRLIHITTDCVFSGEIGGYVESSPHDPRDVYGMTKSLGEPTDNSMVLRTSIIGPEIKNYYSLVSWVLSQKGKTVNGYVNHTWNGITTLTYAHIVERIVKENLYEVGVFHIFSPEIVTKEILVRMISKAFDIDIVIKPFCTDEPVYRHLSTEKHLCDNFDIAPLEKQIEEMRTFSSDSLGGHD